MDVEAGGGITCRMCMCEDDAVFYDIFDSIVTEESVVSKIWNCLNLKVFFGDGLPSFICHQCLYKLNRFNSFREMCHASYIHLRKHQYSTLVQNTIHLEDMKVESVEKKVSPMPSDNGCAVDFPEGTVVDDVPEYTRNETDNVAERSDPFSRELFSHDSDGSEAGPEEPQTTQCASDSVILLRDSCDHSHSVGPNSDVSASDRSSLLLNQPLCTSTNHSASSQILNILKVSSGMILLPTNDILNNESSSISAILPMDNTCKSYSNTTSTEYSTDNRSACPPAIQTHLRSQTGTVTSTTTEVSRENKGYKPWTLGKSCLRENHVLPQLMSTLSQEYENCVDHNNVNSSDYMTATNLSLELEKNLKERRIDLEENRIDRKCKLHTAASNTKCKKHMNKISQRHHQAVNMSSIPKIHKHSSNHACTNLRSDSGKEYELAAQTVLVENDDDPSECCACDMVVSRQNIRKHLHSLQNTRNMKNVQKTFNSI